MPIIYSKILNDDAEIAIWHAIEDTPTLKSMLKRQLLFDPVKSERRKRELICSRILLRKMLGPEAVINYTETGKPVISGRDVKVSIAHTGDFVAVLTHPGCEAGIDIELITGRILNIASKFVSEEEYRIVDAGDTEALYRIWGAKEVAYKIYGEKGVDFKKDLSCFPFENGKIKIRHETGHINKEYLLHSEKLQDHNLMLVYGFDSI
jgi:4'-phosphopantetheinyl transferase